MWRECVRREDGGSRQIERRSVLLITPRTYPTNRHSLLSAGRQQLECHFRQFRSPHKQGKLPLFRGLRNSRRHGGFELRYLFLHWESR